MATTTAHKTYSINKINVKDFIATALEKASDSIGDMVITVLVLGVSIAYMVNTIDHDFLNRVIGLYIAGMIVQLLIRIVHRFDDSYTINEFANYFITYEDELNKRLNRIDGGDGSNE
jgi:hypothetical protein